MDLKKMDLKEKEFVLGRFKQVLSLKLFIKVTPDYMVKRILFAISKSYKDENSIPDVQFTIKENDKVVSVHQANRLYLSKFSPVFTAMFTGPLREAIMPEDNLLNIDIIDIKSDIFSTFLSCICDPWQTFSLQHTSLKDAEILLDLLYAFKKYLCNDIKSILAYKINKFMTLENAFFYYSHRQLYSEILEERCWMALTSSCHRFIHREVFLEMTTEDVIKFLKNINTNAPELELLKAVIKWAQNKIEDDTSGDELQQIKQTIGSEMINAIRYPKAHEEEFFDLIIKYDLPYKEARKKEKPVNNRRFEVLSMESLYIKDPNSENIYMFAIYESIFYEVSAKSDRVRFNIQGTQTIKGFLFATTYVWPKINVQVFVKDDKILDESDALSSVEKTWDKPCAIYRFAKPIDVTTDMSIQINTNLVMTYKVKGFRRHAYLSIQPVWDRNNHAIWGLLTE